MFRGETICGEIDVDRGEGGIDEDRGEGENDEDREDRVKGRIDEK